MRSPGLATEPAESPRRLLVAIVDLTRHAGFLHQLLQLGQFANVRRAIGDAVGGNHLAYQFTHVATWEGPLVAENALRGTRHVMDHRAMPRVTFTDPEVATVGLTEADARERGRDVVAHVKLVREIGKARALGVTEGFVKVVLERGTGHLLGATVVAPHAGDMLPELTMPLHEGGDLAALLATVHPHPTLSEAVKVGVREGWARATG